MAYKKYKSNSKDNVSPEDKATKLIETANENIKKFKNNPENVVEFLNFLSKFNQYSARNNLLIQNQREGSIAVATFPKFKELGYTVNRGEKSMQILRPNFYEYFLEPKTNKMKSIKKANEDEKKLIKEKKILVHSKTTFSQMNVFDVTQTNMPKEEYPKIYPNAHIDFVYKGNNIESFNKALQHYSNQDLNIPVTIEPYNDLAKGKYYPLEKKISLNQKNTPTENAHTLIHELAHSKMHNLEDISSKDNYLVTSTNIKEYQAEMTTYVVAKHFGLDTEEHSINYIAGWTDNLNKIEDEKLFDIYSEVSNTSKEMVSEISNTIEELGLNKEVTTHIPLFPNDKDSVNYCNLTGSPLDEGEPVYFSEYNDSFYKYDNFQEVFSERETEILYNMNITYFTEMQYESEDNLVTNIPNNINPRETKEELRNSLNESLFDYCVEIKTDTTKQEYLNEPVIEIAESNEDFKKGEYYSSSEFKKNIEDKTENNPESLDNNIDFYLINTPDLKSKDNNFIINTTYNESINIVEIAETKLDENNKELSKKTTLEVERE